MDLVAASMKEEGGQHVHGWENITTAEVKATAVLKNKLSVSLVFLYLFWLLYVCIMHPDF